MTFTRNSAVFPVREISLLKEKLVHWTGNFSSGILLDSNSYKNDYSSFEFLAAAGEEIVMAVSQQGVFDSLRQFHDQHHDWLFGYLSYDLKNEVEPRALSINNGAIDEVGFPLAHFFSPSHIIEVSGDSMTIQTTDDPQKIFNSIDKIDIQRNTSLQGSRAVQHRFPRKNYIEAVEQLREHIASGDLYEINLCQEFYIRDFKEDPTSLYQRLNSIAPAPFSCFLNHHQRYLLCSSPERFLRKQGTKMISQPMKGTIRRKDQASVEAEDQLLIERLRNDPKERAENV